MNSTNIEATAMTYALWWHDARWSTHLETQPFLSEAAAHEHATAKGWANYVIQPLRPDEVHYFFPNA